MPTIIPPAIPERPQVPDIPQIPQREDNPSPVPVPLPDFPFLPNPGPTTAPAPPTTETETPTIPRVPPTPDIDDIRRIIEQAIAASTTTIISELTKTKTKTDTDQEDCCIDVNQKNVVVEYKAEAYDVDYKEEYNGLPNYFIKGKDPNVYGTVRHTEAILDEINALRTLLTHLVPYSPVGNSDEYYNNPITDVPYAVVIWGAKKGTKWLSTAYRITVPNPINVPIKSWRLPDRYSGPYYRVITFESGRKLQVYNNSEASALAVATVLAALSSEKVVRQCWGRREKTNGTRLYLRKIERYGNGRKGDGTPTDIWVKGI
jgi:hypothetical protein